MLDLLIDHLTLWLSGNGSFGLKLLVETSLMFRRAHKKKHFLRRGLASNQVEMFGFAAKGFSFPLVGGWVVSWDTFAKPPNKRSTWRETDGAQGLP